MDAQMDFKYAIITILLSHDVYLPLKGKLVFNDKLIGLFQKENQRVDWAGLKSLLRSCQKQKKQNP